MATPARVRMKMMRERQKILDRLNRQGREARELRDVMLIQCSTGLLVYAWAPQQGRYELQGGATFEELRLGMSPRVIWAAATKGAEYE